MATTGTTDQNAKSTEPSIKGEELACALAGFADDKQGENVRVLDVREISTVTDFIVLLSGTSTPHISALRRHIGDEAAKLPGVERNCIDGEVESHWMIIDFWDVMVHIFHPDKREFYALEDLWGDARKVEGTWQKADESGEADA